MAFLTDSIREKLPENSLIRRLDSGDTTKLVEDCKSITTSKIDKRVKSQKESILEKARG